MANCKKCGAEVLEGALFCTECGEALVQPFEEGGAEAVVNPFESSSEIKADSHVGSTSSSNPFAELENSVPEPELASTLVFDDPDWKKAEQIDAQAEAAKAQAEEAAKEAKAKAEAAAKEAQAKMEAAAKEAQAKADAAAQEVQAKVEEAVQHGQGKPSVGGAFVAGAAGSTMAAGNSASSSSSDPKDWKAQSNYGKPQFGETANQQTQQTQQAHQTGWEQAESATPQGAWSAADEKAQQGGFGTAQNQQSQSGFDQGQSQNWNKPMNQQNGQNIYGDYYTDRPQGYDKIWGVISYFSILPWIISYFAGKSGGRHSEFLKHHLNQSLVLNIVSVIFDAIGTASFIGFILRIAVLVLAIMGMITVGQESTKPLPLIGNIKILK